MNLSILFKLTGLGWADCFISIDGNSTHLTASYLDDALGNLANATLRIVHGEKLAYAIFAEEPGEYRWEISKIEETEISVMILWFDDWNGLDTIDDKGKVVLQFKCELLIFVRKIIDCLSKVLNEYGLDGYKKKWNMHEFPLSTYNELRNCLTNPK